MRTLPLDPSLYGAKVGAKAGFDLTVPADKRMSIEFTVPQPPTLEGERFASVRAALEEGPNPLNSLWRRSAPVTGARLSSPLKSCATKVC